MGRMNHCRMWIYQSDMTMDDIVLRIRDLIENEARSCSMDFGCITPLYVYRMLGGAVSMKEISTAMDEIKKNL